MMWIIFLENAVSLICWAALAIYFDKWWIALFSVLFLTSVKTERKHYRICDSCGKHSPYAKDHNEAIEKAKEAGGLRRRVGDKFEDFCPDCRAKMDLEVQHDQGAAS